MPKIKSIHFELIPRDEVPFRRPVAKVAGSPRGSKWDEILRALEREYDRKTVVKIVEPDRKERNKLKSELQTMAKNRGFAVQLYESGTAIYAWMTLKAGRFSAPLE